MHKASLPNCWFRLHLLSRVKRKRTLDSLNGLLERDHLGWCDNQMEMIRHQDKTVPVKQVLVSIPKHYLQKQSCEAFVRRLRVLDVTKKVRD